MFDYFKKSPAIAPFQGSETEIDRRYKKMQMSTFVAATLGYALYYVCRTTLNVVKQPIIDEGILDATQLGVISSALLFAGAGGKVVSGFLGDHSHVPRFMGLGILLATLANLVVGLLGFWTIKQTALSITIFYIVFAVFWGINGIAQSLGGVLSVISISRWFPLSQRGTYYGFWSMSQKLGEFFSFLFAGIIVTLVGWQYGFLGAAAAGLFGYLIIRFMMFDSPESKGLPPIEVYAHEVEENKKPKQENIGKAQLTVLKNPYVWVLTLASAFMYVSRFAVSGWGVLFLQEEKGYSLANATQIISINALLGIIGTVFAGWLSDKVFKGDRYLLAVLSGVLEIIALTLFALGGSSYIANIIAMIIFGISIGVLICLIGGLMVVDIVPREATGMALGLVGMASYIAAGLQDIISGFLIEHFKVGEVYNFTPALWSWTLSAAMSIICVCIVWQKTWRDKQRQAAVSPKQQ